MIEIIGRELAGKRAAYLSTMWVAAGRDTWMSSHHDVKTAGGYDVSVDTHGVAQVAQVLFALWATDAEQDRYPYGPTPEEAAGWVAAKMGEVQRAAAPPAHREADATVVMRAVAPGAPPWSALSETGQRRLV